MLDDAQFCGSCGISTRGFNTATQIIEANETAPYARPEDISLGRILDEKYELLQRLGEGGMGAVYRARRLHIGDEVAVKLLHADLVLEQQSLERFRREARSAAMISHPNVVSIHDFSDGHAAGAAAYIVMELVKGVSLGDLLKREGHLSPEHALALMNDICAGVGIAHRQGLLHRDLKPDNVIVKLAVHEGDRETAKVVDFGLAKLRDVMPGSELTQTGAVIGTLSYMSPEQCSGEELDARADVYSLGAMLYEMLTGRPPFQANNFVGLIAKHLHEAPTPFPESLRIPPALKTACLRALAKDRDQRPADAVAFNKELQRALTAPATPHTAEHSAAVIPVAPPAAVNLERSPTNWLKWAAGFAALLAIFGAAGVGIAVKYGAINIPKFDFNNQNPGANSGTNQNAPAHSDKQQSAATPSQSTPVRPANLKGTWTGTYGPFGQSARLIIKSQQDEKFDGVLEQGAIRVALSGSVHDSTVKMKQSAVLKGGESSWALGEDTGMVSDNGKKMSGTGKDPVGGIVGMSYEWSFSRQ